MSNERAQGTMISMSARADVEKKLASVRARDSRLKESGEKMARGLSKAASQKTTQSHSGRVVKKSAA